MKNIYRKILPVFGATCCFLPNKHQDLFEVIKQSEISNIEAKLEKLSKEEPVLKLTDKKQLKKFVDELNKTKIYLLVTKPQEKKMNKQILLLLHTEDRLNSEQSLINYRHKKLSIFGINNKDDLTKEPDIASVKKNVSIPKVVRPAMYSTLAKAFRGGKSYYINNLGGYKSICPVFFNKLSAADFLLQTSKNALPLLKNLPLKNTKEISNGILNTKIISLGLGDFIEYYSMDTNKKYLNKVEFLFVPNLQKPEKNEKRTFDIKINKNFNKYQKEYYAIKSSETEQL